MIIEITAALPKSIFVVIMIQNISVVILPIVIITIMIIIIIIIINIIE